MQSVPQHPASTSDGAGRVARPATAVHIFTVGLGGITAVGGDGPVDKYLHRINSELWRTALAHGTVVPVPPPSAGCWDHDVHCAAAVARTNHTDVVIFGTLFHSTGGAFARLHLDAFEVPDLVHRSYDEQIPDDRDWYPPAADAAYEVLLGSKR